MLGSRAMPGPGTAAAAPPAGLRRPAFLWALLHVPLVLLLFMPAIRLGLGEVGSGIRLALWPAFALQAAGLALLGFALALPLSSRPRLYRPGAPTLLALGLAVANGMLYVSTDYVFDGDLDRFIYAYLKSTIEK